MKKLHCTGFQGNREIDNLELVEKRDALGKMSQFAFCMDIPQIKNYQPSQTCRENGCTKSNSFEQVLGTNSLVFVPNGQTQSDFCWLVT